MLPLERWRRAPGLVWRHGSPEVLVAQLESLGAAVTLPDGDGGTLVDLGGASLKVVPVASDSHAGLELATRRPAVAPDATRPSSRLSAVAVAVVDLMRWGGADRRAALEEPLLGGRGFVDDDGVPRVLVLEPAREGRLAAALARFGEGPIALYLRAGPASGSRATVSEPPSDRPRLLPPDRPWGPFVVLVEE